MISRHTLALLAERLTYPIEDESEMILVLDKLQYTDDDVARLGIGCKPADLPHLMAPELTQISVALPAGFAPKLQSHFLTGGALVHLV